MDNKTDDKGKRNRARVAFETKIIIETGGESHLYQRTHDVSMNGVFVLTAKPMPIGTKGKFVMTLSVGMRQEDIKGDFEVVRVVSLDEGLSDTERGAGMGLKFTFLEPDSSELLFQVIKYNQFP